MKKKNGFTLIELLAVIVILAIILVIAVPQILKTIENARKSSMEDSAQLIASQAEKQWLLNQVSAEADKVDLTKCDGIVSYSASDYDSCTLTVDDKGAAKVTLTGKTGGKFAGYTCTDATSSSANCVKGSGTTTPTTEPANP